MDTPSQYPQGPSDHPCRVVLLLDGSSSMRRKDWPPSRWIAAVNASESLMAEVARHNPDTQAGVVVFSTQPRLIRSLGVIEPDLGGLWQELRSIRCGGGSNLTAGLTLAAAILQQPQKHPPGRLLQTLSNWVFGSATGPLSPPAPTQDAIILLTDGRHNGGPGPRPLAQRLHQRGVQLNTIGIGKRHEVDEVLLRAIASPRPDGSPRYWYIAEPLELLRQFQVLGRYLRAM